MLMDDISTGGVHSIFRNPDELSHVTVPSSLGRRRNEKGENKIK
jgi:hypothetical protein